jgi:Transcription factor Iwr1
MQSAAAAAARSSGVFGADPRAAAPTPDLVVLRVKRKRGDAPLSSLLIAPDEDAVQPPQSKRQHMQDMMRFFGQVGFSNTPAETPPAATAPQKVAQPLLFRRVRTTEADGSSAGSTVSGGISVDHKSHAEQSASVATQSSHFVEIRRKRARHVIGTTAAAGGKQTEQQAAAATALLAAPSQSVPVQQQQQRQRQADATHFHVIDLVGIAQQQPATASSLPAAVQPPKPPGPQRILNPIERRMDEAIVTAFQTHNARPVLDAIQIGASPSFIRTQADGTTPLMAAAYCGDSTAVARLLALGVNPCVIDYNGNSASALALMQGHPSVVQQLQLAEAQRQSERELAVSSDFVYDFYCYDKNAARSSISSSSSSTIEQQQAAVSNSAAANMQVIRIAGIAGAESMDTSTDDVDTAAADNSISGVTQQTGLSAFATAQGPVELVFEHDSDWSNLADTSDDEDSNDENYYKNEYPEEESDTDNIVQVNDENDDIALQQQHDSDSDDYDLTTQQETAVSSNAVTNTTSDLYSHAYGDGAMYSSSGLQGVFGPHSAAIDKSTILAYDSDDEDHDSI